MSTVTNREALSFATGTNAPYIEDQYQEYIKDPESLDPTWRAFFAGYELASSSGGTSEGGGEGRLNARVEAMINAYRRLGHLSSHLNPLAPHPGLSSDMKPSAHGLDDVADDTIIQPANLPTSEMSFIDVTNLLQDTYCRTVGADFREMSNIDAVVWLQQKMEGCRNRPAFDTATKKTIHKTLVHAEGFERFLQDRYLGQKRFSLEGTDALIPLLHFLSDKAAEVGVKEINLGMAHRGRLNVLANFMGKSKEMLLKEFEGTDFNPFDIDGDVKYHMGFSSEQKTVSGKDLLLCLLPNPSHLEAVNPVVEGFVRARQEQTAAEAPEAVLPLLMHGDAAFIGQGVVAETLNLELLEDYSTAGTIHIITNNQIGFTANPEEGRSCTYSSEIAKIIRAPVLHVNADDPEAVVWTAQLAAEFRQKFKRDVVIDLIGYRRHGHNETDEPMFTQPLMYKTIKSHPTCLTLYNEQLEKEGVQSKEESAAIFKEFREELQAKLDRLRAGTPAPAHITPEAYAEIDHYTKAGREDFEKAVKTQISKTKLLSLGKKITTFPSDFTPHPKIKKLFEQRAAMLDGEGKIDWGMAEILAYGSLALDGRPVRLSGQDCRRGTFSHRHGVVRDFETGDAYEVLSDLEEKQAKVTIINSPLSEAGVLGFEFGYSVATPKGLTIWEAQFGDFANGAQILVDQFLVASEAKWKQTSGLIMLLPHGHEGMGPEHSSARPERFLQLCGNLNIQVANPTTPAQLFHLLRRQTLRHFRKPLIIMSPKSLLRHPKVISSLKDITAGKFQEAIDDIGITDGEKVKTIVVCSGKLYYDICAEREKNNQETHDIALVRLEQLYPFPDKQLTKIFQRYSNAKTVLWSQEEPMNMGGWFFARHRLELIASGLGVSVEYNGRKGSGTTAEGSSKAHAKEQERIVMTALGQTCSLNTTTN